MYEYKVVLIAEAAQLRRRKLEAEIVEGDLPDVLLQTCLDTWAEYGYKLHTLHCYNESRMLVVLERKAGAMQREVVPAQAGTSA